ncbi:flippase activity-associated protein Agl23 [Halapricum hydrolyticum]|uniref:TIGR03663 family protein n=1 Tax=Halapricum hydrolyticum TaxID=2979991 RepID=A0AAE3IGC7_9EURY|nr:flippase activity-associated protein Agl23 [Halapricum hydrolyticum]MCU4719093.1 TIGR03663 family protein [Halapricum hydrolyticum]MCU4728134.1 TIGR03663 family protein [Halapricum hydrolyticum]
MSDAPPDARVPSSSPTPHPVVARLREYDTVLLGVAVVALLALAARLIALGARPAHWDEARVAYWALYAQEEGHFAYRSIVHGPFIQHVDRWLFGLLGPNDFVMRLPVALIGGLLPLAALLFRDHLRDAETVALSLFLAFNPVLLYYSRFMRSDVLVGAFAFVALGMIVRLLERRRVRYLYGAALCLALAVASKENSLLYLLTWLGAGVLVADRALDRPGSNRTGIDRLGALATTGRLYARRAKTQLDTRKRVGVYALHALGALAVFALVWLFMFAPRGDGLEGLLTGASEAETVGLGEAMSDPTKWGPLLDATVEQFRGEYLAWGGKTGGLTFEDYQDRLGGALRDGLIGTSAPLVFFAIAGFVRERYAVAEGRVLVFFLFYAGAASIVGYPLGLSIGGGWKWNNVHVLLPLSIPAAVGLATIYRWGREAYQEDEPIDVGLTALILVMVVATVAWSGATHVYLNPSHESNDLVQFGQPYDDLDPVVEELQAAAPGENPDVLVYGNASEDASIVGPVHSGRAWNVRPVCTDFGKFLPMQWYLASTGTNASCAREPAGLRERVEQDRPPVVITRLGDDSVPTAWLEDNYEDRGTFSLRYREGATPTIQVYVRK